MPKQSKRRTDGRIAKTLVYQGTRYFRYGKTNREAQQKLDRLRVELETGTYSAAQNQTVGAWFWEWFELYKSPYVKPQTARLYARVIRKHIDPAIGKIPMAQLNVSHIQKLYSSRVSTHSPAFIRDQLHKVVSMGLDQAVKNRLILFNYAKQAKRPPASRRLPTLLTSHDIQTLLACNTEEWLYAAIVLAVGLGLRRGEILGLRWDDVDFPHKTLHIRATLDWQYTGKERPKMALIRTTAKTEKSRRNLPLVGSCYEALRKHWTEAAEIALSLGKPLEPADPVFSPPGSKKPTSPATLRSAFLKMLKQAGLGDAKIRLHDLRHTFATQGMAHGENPKVMQHLLGHASVTTTLDIYSHVTPPLAQDTVIRLDKILTGDL